MTESRATLRRPPGPADRAARPIRAMAAAIIACVAALAPARAHAQIKMSIIGPGSQLAAMAVSQLKNLSGDDDHEVSKAFTRTLKRDLELSGYFRIVDPHAYIEDPQQSGYELGQFNFADWRSINTDFLVKGAVTVNGSNVQLTAFLYDVAQQRRMMGKNFTGAPDDVPRMARRFADSILEATTGQKGPFDTKLAFVSTGKGRFKEIYTQSIDGQDLFKLTDNPTINLFPDWDQSVRYLLYVSYKSGEPGLYLADLKRQVESRITSNRGFVIGGALSPDAQLIVAAIERGGSTNLYLIDRSGHELRKLTDTRGINCTPAFSRDGSKIAFTSDRSGTPQIYVMPLSGGAPTRITYKGSYNTNPAFSPKGDRIAYQSRNAGHFDIYTIPVAGGDPVLATDGIGSNESPSWSPDGRYLAFSSTREGRPHIFVLMLQSGKIIASLTEGNGNDTSPAWSWWLGD
jgi:TolB protein